MSKQSKRFLHVGCGPKRPELLPPEFSVADWVEVRLDKEAVVEPDIVADMSNMSEVAGEEYDAVFCSHALEHLFEHELALALAEFKRVLKPDGYAHIVAPDLESIAQSIQGAQIEETVYESKAGPITPLDMIFGYRPAIAAGAVSMAHKTGFTNHRLGRLLVTAGFPSVTVSRRQANYDLSAYAYMNAHPIAVQDAQKMIEHEGRADGRNKL